jgi:hypothetical protein
VPSGSGSGSGTENLDVSLVAVSLATLFAVVRRLELVSGISQSGLFAIFQQCLRSIVDPRLGRCVGRACQRGNGVLFFLIFFRVSFSLDNFT